TRMVPPSGRAKSGKQRSTICGTAPTSLDGGRKGRRRAILRPRPHVCVDDACEDGPVARALRLALVVLGLAAVVYGTSTLTGCWLGEAPGGGEGGAGGGGL